MKLAESLETLYRISHEVMGEGHIEAKEFTVDVVFNAISDLQDQNLPVTAEAIEKLVGQIAQDFKEVAESKVA